MNKIPVTFTERHFEFAPDELSQFGSRHYDRRQVQKNILPIFNKRVCEKVKLEMEFEDFHILAANEVFPEAAIFHPIKDLEVWDEWRSGIRAFHYPGVYRRFDIGEQFPKTSSKSTTGVIGEIMAGIFAQAGIAPEVLVRMIHRWPDFIFLDQRTNCFSFLESKATLTLDDSSLEEPKLNELIGNFLTDCVQELNSDSRLTIWGSFTQITNMNPLKLKVDFIRVTRPPTNNSAITLPISALVGLIHRSTERAGNKLTSEEWGNFAQSHKEAEKNNYERIHTEIMLEKLVNDELLNLLDRLGISKMTDLQEKTARNEIKNLIKNISTKHIKKENIETNESRRILRTVSTILEGHGLTEDEFTKIKKTWAPDWKKANEPFTYNGKHAFRCGGSIFTIRSAKSF